MSLLPEINIIVLLMKIKYINHNDINQVKWDNCINNAFNGNVFAFSWFLNIIHDHWDAMIIGDYKYIFPVLKYETYGYKILGNPNHQGKFGLFSNELISEDIFDQFISFIIDKFKFIYIPLNKYNRSKKYKLSKRESYELDITQSYGIIIKKYSEEFTHSLQFSAKNKIQVVKGLTPGNFIDFYKNNKNRYPKLNPGIIQKIISSSLRFRSGEIYGAYDFRNELCAIAFFILSKRKAYLLISALNRIGSDNKAIHAIINKYIFDHCEENYTLNLDNICWKKPFEIFLGVNSIELETNHLLINKLPWYISYK